MENNIITIYGEVPELIDKKTNELTQQYLQTDKDDFNFASFNLNETEISVCIEEAMTLPFFSDEKAVVIKNAYVFTGEKGSKDVTHNLEQLQEFIEKFDGPSLVIFEVYNQKLDERKKLVKTLKKHSKLIKIEQMSEEELKNWIKTSLNEQYKDIKQDALNLFIDLTGINFNLVKQELDKIILYLGDRPTITKQDVETIVNRSLEQNVFLLTDYIQQGKKPEAVNLVNDLITMKEEPIKLLALIASNFRLYYQCKILAKKGYSQQQIAKTVSVHPFRVKLALRASRQYDLRHLMQIMNACAETDYKLKSSYMDKQLILELFILSI
ncbi:MULTISPECIES: DNA polymerase III subunit delta [Staphylococcus]|uniref:DNA polymerase III subunit delta n=1 Tax=Staphylococcus TaxID=1279 RepID=UPI000DF8352A|nr:MULTISPECIES: DNA polymerase III subunit delta [unclassified Staphylococcus]UXV33795.1 DNA polymerase III subunit delta [Staphylococcus sp. IVB6181]